jgi:hypothetical protein
MQLHRPLNRIEPKLPPHLMNTHLILAPPQTHFRPATCEEVGCPHFLEGWRVKIDALPPEMVHAAKNSGRRWREIPVAPGETWLEFEPGQKCFKWFSHRVRLDRPELYLKREGDHRGNPRRLDDVKFSGPDAWADSLGTQLDQIEKRR